MHADRDHLVKVVFPALLERLEKHRIYLVDIDVRWAEPRLVSDDGIRCELSEERRCLWVILPGSKVAARGGRIR